MQRIEESRKYYVVLDEEANFRRLRRLARRHGITIEKIIVVIQTPQSSLKALAGFKSQNSIEIIPHQHLKRLI